MKLFLVALLCVAAAAAYSEDDLEYGLFEDVGILEQIKERIKQGFQAALDRVKALIEKYKPAVANLKERLAELGDRVKDLLTQTGRNFTKTVQEIGAKIRELIRDVLRLDAVEAVEYSLYEGDEDLTLLQKIRKGVQALFEKLKALVADHKEVITAILKEKIEQVKKALMELALEHGAKLITKAHEVAGRIVEIIREVFAKIGKKEEAAVYAVEEEGETFLQALKRRIIERLQKAFETLKEKVKQVHGDISEKVIPKIQEITNMLRELAKSSGEKLLEIAGHISEKIREIFQDVKDKIVGDVLYAEEEEESNPTLLQRIVKRLQARLQRAVDRVKNLIANHKELIEAFKEKFENVKTAIADLVNQKREQLREAVRNIFAKIGELRKSIREKLGLDNYYIDIKEAARALRDFFITDEGIAAIKDNAANANPTTQTGLLVKAFVLAATPDALKDLIRELFKNVYYVPVAEYQDIKELVKKASAWLQTNEGVAAIRAYAKGLQTTHPVVLRLKAMLETATDDEVKSLFRDIFTIHF